MHKNLKAFLKGDLDKLFPCSAYQRVIAHPHKKIEVEDLNVL